MMIIWNSSTCNKSLSVISITGKYNIIFAGVIMETYLHHKNGVVSLISDWLGAAKALVGKTSRSGRPLGLRVAMATR